PDDIIEIVEEPEEVIDLAEAPQDVVEIVEEPGDVVEIIETEEAPPPPLAKPGAAPAKSPADEDIIEVDEAELEFVNPPAKPVPPPPRAKPQRQAPPPPGARPRPQQPA